MWCPNHFFEASPGCPFCCHFAAGYFAGIWARPAVWYRGARSIARQRSILPPEGSPEQEENRVIRREARAVWRLTTRRNIRTVREGWNHLPSWTRRRLVEEGFHVVGFFLGGVTATYLFMLTGSFLVGRYVSARPQLRPLLEYRRPAYYSANVVLQLLTIQATRDHFVHRYHRLSRQHPQLTLKVQQVWRRMTREPPPDDDDDD